VSHSVLILLKREMGAGHERNGADAKVHAKSPPATFPTRYVGILLGSPQPKLGFDSKPLN